MAEYLDSHTWSVAPSEEDFGFANGAGPDSFEISQATLVGSVDFCNFAVDDWGNWRFGDGSLVVTR